MRKVLVFFGILDDGDVEWLVSTGIRKEVAAGDVLIREGTNVDAMFLVIDGVFDVTVGEKEVARLNPGEIVGEMSFVDARPPSASVKALERSLVLSIARSKLTQKLHDDTPFAARFYRALAVFLADRLRRSVSQLGYGQLGPTTQQISDRDELDPDVLENLALASGRFDQMQRRLKGIGCAT
jgi:CRP/FNR family cyclic AMP-dependent transcriptional regulator